MDSHTASKFLEISVASIKKHAMNYQCTKMFQRHRDETWNDKLCHLSVHAKKVSQSDWAKGEELCVETNPTKVFLLVTAHIISTLLNIRRWICVLSLWELTTNCPSHPVKLPNCTYRDTPAWRHDSTLKALTYGLKKSLPTQTNYLLICQLLEWYTTVPSPDILDSNKCPTIQTLLSLKAMWHSYWMHQLILQRA